MLTIVWAGTPTATGTSPSAAASTVTNVTGGCQRRHQHHGHDHPAGPAPAGGWVPVGAAGSDGPVHRGPAGNHARGRLRLWLHHAVPRVRGDLGLRFGWVRGTPQQFLDLAEQLLGSAHVYSPHFSM